ncbi:hypothetical protein [Pseudobacteriovorax antillogorgiicola]|uniref:Uncharacterized protein n=1 Tax=Pseudobacteriovorax antillogorgiicola TaxID=1513793 RepID=A0A1Y6B7J5_9BACT|nr:hypothetical protein [Pseudobacteriovorax antillogorgiicola]TCS58600.1 hypothetical protein EDD56_102113 [Pseudobacteriovorax antillogorgiicola]SME97015.1 hypothetical protein SAMN06296036_102330 [Pseudobacteriovorax antillogorgiicola]
MIFSALLIIAILFFKSAYMLVPWDKMIQALHNDLRQVRLNLTLSPLAKYHPTFTTYRYFVDQQIQLGQCPRESIGAFQQQLVLGERRCLKASSLATALKMKVLMTISFASAVRFVWGGQWLPTGVDLFLSLLGGIWVGGVYLWVQVQLAQDWLLDERQSLPWLEALFTRCSSDSNFTFLAEFSRLEQETGTSYDQEKRAMTEEQGMRLSQARIAKLDEFQEQQGIIELLLALPAFLLTNAVPLAEYLKGL